LATSQILQAYDGPTSNASGVLALAYESHTHGIPQQDYHHQQQPPLAVTPPTHYQQQQQQGNTRPYAGNFQQQQQPPVIYHHPPPSPQYNPSFASPEVQGYHPASPVSVMNTPERPLQPLMMVTPTMMKPLNLVEEEDFAQPHLTDLERAMKHLVNFDDITEPLETPEQIKTKLRHMEKQPLKSKPLPPKEPEWHLGLTPLLADIQKHKQPTPPPTKEVMRTHAFDPAAAHAGRMVVYGQTSLPVVSGFGAGFHSGQYGGYYQHNTMMYATAPPVSSTTSTAMAPPVYAAY
jgi:hypothetical protein